MKILGIDTSTRICSLGLVREKEILIEYNLNGLKKKHSSILIPAIKDMLETVDLRIKEIEGIAISIGPGSFTGLRIGLGVAKGLSYACSLPLLGIPTLDVLAYSLKGIPYLICPILESKKNEIYSALFRGGDNFNKILEYKCEDIYTLLARIGPLKEKIIFLGEGVKNYQEIIEKKMGSNALFTGSQLFFPRGVNVAFLGMEKLKKGRKDDIATLSPLYLRKSEAEIIWEKKNKSKKDG